MAWRRPLLQYDINFQLVLTLQLLRWNTKGGHIGNSRVATHNTLNFQSRDIAPGKAQCIFFAVDKEISTGFGVLSSHITR